MYTERFEKTILQNTSQHTLICDTGNWVCRIFGLEMILKKSLAAKSELDPLPLSRPCVYYAALKLSCLAFYEADVF